MLAILFATAILAGYVSALWWLLRREPARVLAGVAILCGVALALRLVETGHFPSGLNEDEPKILACAWDFWRWGQLFKEGCTGMPVLLNVLFQAQLIPLFGTDFWSIRLYSMLTSVLATPAAYATARAMGLRSVPSLAAGLFVAVLPWSLFYGRISIGGELVFHQMLLLAALARLVWRDGSWPELAIGALGQSLLLYDYFAGRAMLPFSLVAAALVRGRRGLLCLAIPLIAVAAWIPHLMTGPRNAVGGVLVELLQEGVGQGTLWTPIAQAGATLRALALPVARDAFLTVRAAAVHPAWFLVLAAGGLLIPSRRSAFLGLGLVIGLLPAVLSGGPRASTHRMMMAYPFIALAAAAALSDVPWRRGRGFFAVAAAALAAVQGAALYFSPWFWHEESRATFDAERTAVVAAIPPPPHPPVYASIHLSYFSAPRRRTDPNIDILRAENFMPKDGASIYAFSAQAVPLQAFYLRLFGPERVRIFDRAFLVTLENTPWTWLRQHGWSYEIRCGQTVKSAPVPALFHAAMSFDDAWCGGEMEHVWRGRWQGPERRMRLRFAGAAKVEIGGASAGAAHGAPGILDFRLPPDADVRVRVVTQPPKQAVYAALFELRPEGERVPVWESVTPVSDAAPATRGR